MAKSGMALLSETAYPPLLLMAIYLVCVHMTLANYVAYIRYPDQEALYGPDFRRAYLAFTIIGMIAYYCICGPLWLYSAKYAQTGKARRLRTSLGVYVIFLLHDLPVFAMEWHTFLCCSRTHGLQVTTFVIQVMCFLLSFSIGWLSYAYLMGGVLQSQYGDPGQNSLKTGTEQLNILPPIQPNESRDDRGLAQPMLLDRGMEPKDEFSPRRGLIDQGGGVVFHSPRESVPEPEELRVIPRDKPDRYSPRPEYDRGGRRSMPMLDRLEEPEREDWRVDAGAFSRGGAAAGTGRRGSQPDVRYDEDRMSHHEAPSNRKYDDDRFGGSSRGGGGYADNLRASHYENERRGDRRYDDRGQYDDYDVRRRSQPATPRTGGGGGGSRFDDYDDYRGGGSRGGGGGGGGLRMEDTGGPFYLDDQHRNRYNRQPSEGRGPVIIDRREI